MWSSETRCAELAFLRMMKEKHFFSQQIWCLKGRTEIVQEHFLYSAESVLDVHDAMGHQTVNIALNRSLSGQVMDASNGKLLTLSREITLVKLHRTHLH